eukprot:COSAG01_NODE_6116_length_3845_cov_144.351590_3_plen_93_part_00
MCNNGCNSQVCPRYESSQNFVHTDRIEDKISGLKSRYGGYVSGSIVVLMSCTTTTARGNILQIDTTGTTMTARGNILQIYILQIDADRRIQF